MTQQEFARPSFSMSMIPLRGAFCFLSRPSLWWKPLSITMLVFFLILTLFSSIIFFLWPTAGTILSQTEKGIEATLFASFGVFLFWIFIMPFLFSMAYESMLVALLKEEGKPLHNERIVDALAASFFVLRKTLFTRIFWLFFPLLFLIFSPLLFSFFALVGAGYILLIDAVDLSLATRGYSKEVRVTISHSHRLAFFGGAVSCGFFLTLSTMTFVGFLFILPSIYAGAFLWTDLTTKTR